MESQSQAFPWDLGVFDAHCHPTDTMSSIDDIPTMKARTLAIMATREQDQHLVAEVATRLDDIDLLDHSDPKQSRPEKKIIPCFGWHPWVSHLVFDDTHVPGKTPIDKIEHYKAVLTPPIQDELLLAELPSPRPLSAILQETRQYLTQFPHALVGEVGLDRSFRIPNAWFSHELESRDLSRTPGFREGRTLSPHRVPLSHQKAILKAQLRLAGELQRPVSVHSVQAHGAVLEILCDLWKGYEIPVLSKRQRHRRGSAVNAHGDESEEEIDRNQHPTSSEPYPFPPRVCMHSYSGPADPLKLFLHPSNPADVYFSFSSTINFPNGSVSKAVEVMKAVPDDRILVESDLHIAGEKMDYMLEVIVRTICDVRSWKLEDGIKRLGNNWKRFIHG